MNPKERVFQDFPGDAVVETCLSMQGGARLIPGQGTKIPHASWPKNQNIKQKQCVTNSIKTFKKWKRTESVSHLVLSDSLQQVDCSPPGSSSHGLLQARTLEYVAISFSRGSSRPRDQTWVSRNRQILYHLPSEPPRKPFKKKKNPTSKKNKKRKKSIFLQNIAKKQFSPPSCSYIGWNSPM